MFDFITNQHYPTWFWYAILGIIFVGVGAIVLTV